MSSLKKEKEKKVLRILMGIPGDSVVKNHLPMQETWVQSLVQEDPLEKEMATHSNILAWKIPWTEEPGRPESLGSQRVGYNLATKQQQDKNIHQIVRIT